MSTLHRLRQQGAGLLGRLVLLWFALTVGAAIAAPIVSPPTLELVCSSTGAAKIVVRTDAGVPTSGAAHLDCPLCLPTGAPPPVVPAIRPALPQAPSHAPRAVLAVRRVAATTPPLPARGPPAL